MASRADMPAAASESLPKTSARRNRSLRVRALGLTVAPVLVSLLWLCFKVRAELASRADAQAARRLVADGKYQEAGALLERWLKAKPNAAEPHFLAARATIGLGLVRPGPGRTGQGANARLPRGSHRSRARHRTRTGGTAHRG